MLTGHACNRARIPSPTTRLQQLREQAQEELHSKMVSRAKSKQPSTLYAGPLTSALRTGLPCEEEFAGR